MLFLNPKIKHIGNDKSFLGLEALRDIYPLVIHKIKLSRGRQADNFLKYPIPEFNAGNKMFARNHT